VSLFYSEIARDPGAQQLARCWVAALRSGRYRQVGEHLRTDLGFCCLGVACDVYRAGRWRRRSGGEWVFLDQTAELPLAVLDAYQLRSTDARFGPHLESDSLLIANDRGQSFAWIADLIERELEAAIARGIRREARR
jgi:hypothetical protein